MPAEKDPNTLVHECLWAILEDNALFCTLVPSQYRVKLVDSADGTPAPMFPERDVRVPPEQPQVLIRSVAGEDSMYVLSDKTRLREHFEIWINSGDRRLCYLQNDNYQGVNPVKLEILRALMNWQNRMSQLSWKGVTDWVTHCMIGQKEVKSESPRAEQQDAPPKTTGWNMVCRGLVEMWFDSALLPS